MAPRESRVSWLARLLAIIAVVAALAVVAVVVALYVEHRTPLALPSPTGKFAVGRDIQVFRAEPDAIAPVAADTRELLVWIWYPAALEHLGGATEEYLPAPMRQEVARAHGWLFSSLLTRDLSQVRTHSVRDVQVSPREPAYPVVILRGGGSAEVWNYSALAEDLASHGYVVVGFDAPYRTNVVVFPDGRVMRRSAANNPELCLQRDELGSERCIKPILAAWVADVGFVLDTLQLLNAGSGRYAGRLDLTRVGVFGHSLGGATAMQFCHDDLRCKAVIDIDGAPHGSVIAEGLRRPLMLLLSDHRGESGPGTQQVQADFATLYDRSTEVRVRLMIRGANHFFFSDDAALLKSRIVISALRLLGLVRIEGARQIEITRYCVRNFFDAYLGRGTTLRLDRGRFPEIEFFD